MYRDAGKKRLSKGILDMKFMQRSKVKAQQEEVDEEGQELLSLLVAPEMKRGKNTYSIIRSSTKLENLIDGRLSFQGMNPKLERLLELEREEKKNSISNDNSNEVDVTDKEMATYQSSLIKTMASRFAKKNSDKTKEDNSESLSPVRKKRKFMKPKDD
uniref:M-phase phosphoprotein 6 n=1 Tax=Clastoptera arizonana TaxID=38151 RepID=A0A1B6C7L3_9HEMI